MIKFMLLTCDTWVTEWDWFDYALRHPRQVPFLLVDRSPCTDPFLDPYASSEERRPIISGLCRCLKNFQQGDIYIYITRMRDRRVCHALNIPTKDKTPYYLGIAALRVAKVHESHAEAAKTFTTFKPRRYVVAPDPTPYPPNLAHDLHMPAAVLRENCIVSLGPRTHYTPDHSTDACWRKQVKSYYLRQMTGICKNVGTPKKKQKRQLSAAECRLVQVDGRDVLQLDPAHAPVLTPDDWGGIQMNVNGRKLQEKKWADHLCQLIADGR